jgi:threonine aldolase
VIAVDSGHIATHETGAIEATGHKVIHVPQVNGKLTPAAIEQVMRAHPNEHSVKPRMAFISQATELGTVYSRTELLALRAVCDAHGLWLYIDGARLGSALCSVNADCDWQDIARFADVFYIGGTKNGALLGEAIVFPNTTLNNDFRYALKQRGALLAKGRVIASQFIALFEHDLYTELAQHANACAMRLRTGLSELGVVFYTDSATNQQFPILPNTVIKALQKDYGFYTWEVLNERESVVRFVFSWATPMAMVDELLTNAKRLLHP